MEQSCIFGQGEGERGDEGGRLQLRPRSSGPIFASRHSDNVGFRGGAFGENVDQQEQMNTWNTSLFQRGDVLTSKTGIFGSQARSEGLGGFSVNLRSRTCSASSTSSTSSSCSSNSCSSCSTCSSCSSQEAKGWSSRSPPKELYKYI